MYLTLRTVALGSPMAHFGTPRVFPPEAGPPFAMFAMGDPVANTFFRVAFDLLWNSSHVVSFRHP
jgi:hypothetical protein